MRRTEADQQIEADRKASAQFSGAFTVTGPVLRLLVDFVSRTDDTEGPRAGAQLFLSLTIDGMQLLNEMFNTSTFIEQFFVVPFGALGVLDLAVVSSAESLVGGAPLNEAQVRFLVETVPEAPTLWMFAIGLLGLVLIIQAPRVRSVHV